MFCRKQSLLDERNFCLEEPAFETAWRHYDFHFRRKHRVIAGGQFLVVHLSTPSVGSAFGSESYNSVVRSAHILETATEIRKYLEDTDGRKEKINP
jgi:hypothetical protein